MAPPFLAAIECTAHIHLIIGCSPLAQARCTRVLSAGARAIVITDEEDEGPEPERPHEDDDIDNQARRRRPTLPSGLQDRADRGEIALLRRPFRLDDVLRLGRKEVAGVVDAVFVTPRPAQDGRDNDFITNKHIFDLCSRNRIPINVIDSHSLSTFTLLAEHSDGPVRIGITTSGRGCRLAARIRREIGAILPPGLGQAVDLLGRVRESLDTDEKDDGGGDNNNGPLGNSSQFSFQETRGLQDDDMIPDGRLGSPILPRTTNDQADRRKVEIDRQKLWLAQVCEYWPLTRLSRLTEQEIRQTLDEKESSLQQPATSLSDTNNTSSGSPSPTNSAFPSISSTTTAPTDTDAHPTPSPELTSPHIALAGSGPGHPSLLTATTVQALLSYPVILADKLVPAPILKLIPRRTTIHIARKFPGNSTAGQAELQALAIEAMERGLPVLRLKQGDPFVFGRGGEEMDWFAERGWPVRIIPGLSSAVAATACAGISLTKRGLADGFEVRTGTAAEGKDTGVVGYRDNVTEVWLMAVHRLERLVGSMLAGEEVLNAGDQSTKTVRKFTKYPPTLPCAIIERASCHDQRVIRSTLGSIVSAVAELGGRPPGLFVLGRVCGERTPTEIAESVEAAKRGKTENGDNDGIVAGSSLWTVQEGWMDAPQRSSTHDTLSVLGSVGLL